jgi:DNA-binding NarL/FixJ family response regulator
LLARLARELRRQRHGQAILVYDGALEAEYARGALEAGVRGWLTRRDDLAEVSQAVTAVLRGDLHLSRQAADRLAGIFSPRSNGASRSSGDLTRLSEREREVLNLMRGGLRGKEIAFRLGISPKTVETHQQRMREKLHVKSSADLANLAVT